MRLEDILQPMVICYCRNNKIIGPGGRLFKLRDIVKEQDEERRDFTFNEAGEL
jgi:hypothetical protein